MKTLAEKSFRVALYDDGAVDLLNSFRSASLFEDVAESDLHAIASRAQVVRCFSGQTLVEEGEPGADIYLLLQGRVRIQVESISPFVEIGITKLEAGEVIGEMSLVENHPRSATVLAIEPSVFARIPSSHLRDLAVQKPEVGFILMRNVARILSDRLKAMNRRMMNVIRQKHF